MEQNQTNFSQPAAAEQPPINQPVGQQTEKMPGPIALFKESLNVYKKHFGSLISISLLFLLGPLFGLIISGVKIEFPVIIWLFLIFFSIGLFLLNVLISIALMIAVRSLMSGAPVQTIGSLRSALGLLIPVIGVNILSTFVIAGATIPLLIPGVIVSILLYFSLFSLVIEGQRGFSALMRSRHLIKGNVVAVFL